MDFLGHLEADFAETVPAPETSALAAIKSFMHFMEYRVPLSAGADSAHSESHSSKENGYPSCAPPHRRRDAIDPGCSRSSSSRRYPGSGDVASVFCRRPAECRVSGAENRGSFPTASSRAFWSMEKVRKERCLPLWKETASALRAWLTVRGKSRAPELFLNARGTSMTRGWFRVHPGQTCLRCDEAMPHPRFSTKRISPHVLRHTCALTDSPGHQRSAQGLALARLHLKHANHRDFTRGPIRP